MKLLRMWWMVFTAIKTPLIFPLDLEYERVPYEKFVGHYARAVTDRDYTRFHDCSSFAWLSKAEIHKDYSNGIGYVFGIVTWARWKWLPFSLHCWNVCLTDEGTFQYEPQNAYIWQKDKSYIPLWVLI